MGSRTWNTRVSKAKARDVSWLNVAVDISLAVIFCIGPLLLGGRHPVGRFGLAVMIAGSCCLWLCQQISLPANSRHWRPLGAAWLVLMSAGLVILQISPLPVRWIEMLAPGMHELLPMWRTAGDGSSWRTLSLAPEATRSGVAMSIAYVCFFIMLWQRLTSLVEMERLLKLIAISTVWLAVIGILQLLTSEGKFLWLYEHPTRDTFRVTKGPFQNQNHFGCMMAMGLGPLIWWIAKKLKQSQEVHSNVQRNKALGFGGFNPSMFTKTPADQYFAWLIPASGSLLVGLAAFLTFSRGAMIAMAVAAITAITLYAIRKMLPLFVLISAVGGGLVVAGLGIATSHELWKAKVLQSLDSESVASLSPARFKLWEADFAAHQRFPWFGTGVGSHRYVYRVFFPTFEDSDSAYAESSIVHMLLETGRVGLALVFVCGMWTIFCMWRVWQARSQSHVAIGIACLSCLAASAFQAIADFVWQIPACTLVVLASMAVLWRLPSLLPSSSHADEVVEETNTGHAPFIGTALVFAMVAPLMLSILWPECRAAGAWDHYLRISREDMIADARGKIDGKNLAETQFQEKLTALENALKFDRKNARIHERLMLLYLTQIEYRHGPMLLWSVMAEALPDQSQQKKWKEETFGKDLGVLKRIEWHADQTMRYAPISGRAYIVKAGLRRLRLGRFDRVYDRLLHQAYVVRATDPFVLMNLGISASITGDLSKAMAYWGRAAEVDETDRFNSIPMLVRVFPVAQLIEELKPNDMVTRKLLKSFRESGDTAATREVGLYLLNQIDQKMQGKLTNAQSFDQWCLKSEVQAELGQEVDSAQALKRAVNLQPTNYELRLKLSAIAFKCQWYAEAVEQLRWCVRRRPDDFELRELLKKYQTVAIQAGNGNSGRVGSIPEGKLGNSQKH